MPAGKPSQDTKAAGPRAVLRWLLRINAVLWALFGGGMLAVAFLSVEARAHAVFQQVLIASLAAAVGALAAARYRLWGVWLTLAGGLGVLVAWIAGDSGDIYRLPVAMALGVFCLLVVAQKRAFVSRPGP